MKPYQPENISVFDPWFTVVDGKAHCFHLQQRPAGKACPEQEDGAIGHAVSDDLIHWRRLPNALTRGLKGALDDGELWTGCAYVEKGIWYLYYTARSLAEDCTVNRVALATSSDGVTFKKKGVLFSPDNRYYCSEQMPLRLKGPAYQMVDCRDLLVIRDPLGGYLGYFAARQPRNTCSESAVIALCHSDDLIHWEQLPPCLVQDRFPCVEVPDVFEMNGLWYLLCLTGTHYGARSRLPDPTHNTATVYAVAENPRGPFRFSENPVLLSSDYLQAHSARSLVWHGTRYLLAAQNGGRNPLPDGCLSLPLAISAQHGKLSLVYDELIRTRFAPPFFPGDALMCEAMSGHYGNIGTWRKETDVYVGSCPHDWALLPFSNELDGNCMADVQLVIQSAGGSAGMVLALGETVVEGGAAIILDSRLQRVVFTRLRDFPVIESALCKIDIGTVYAVKVVRFGSVWYVYLNGQLMITCKEYLLDMGAFALYVERGEATFIKPCVSLAD